MTESTSLRKESIVKVHMTTHTIGDWSLKWYEIQPLIGDMTLPL